MDFSFILPGVKRKGEALKETNNIEIKNIGILREQLIATGYNPGEVDFMIKTACNNVDLTELDSKQLKDLEAVLQEQLTFARQCIEMMKGPK